MSVADKKEYCKYLANHLRYISRLLWDNGLIKDVGPIESAASMYQRSLNVENNSYVSVVDQLIFQNVDPDRKFRKIKPIKFSNEVGLELEFSIEFKGNLPVIEYCDPLQELAANFKLLGIGNDGSYLINSWHIDRHISNEKDVPYFPHPLYHIQYGGKLMTESEDLNHGNILLVDTPRIPCPPFDVALSVDYILSNYYGSIWYSFKQDDRYNDAISHSRDVFWKIYYKSISDSFYDNVEDNKLFEYYKINPLLK